MSQPYTECPLVLQSLYFSRFEIESDWGWEDEEVFFTNRRSCA